jgi:polyphosphate kinase 2 (PPK2 family)
VYIQGHIQHFPAKSEVVIFDLSRPNLDLMPYKKVKQEKVEMVTRSMKHAYDDQKSPEGQKFVKEKY